MTCWLNLNLTVGKKIFKMIPNNSHIHKIRTGYILIWCLLIFAGCDSSSFKAPSIPANDAVAKYISTFEGRGAQRDDSEPTNPFKALESFIYPDDIALDLLASEPLIVQPVEINFDHRGRLWVVQYSQYPFPAGLKVVNYDYHLRAQFDKMPDPPPLGIKGADKISLLEDTDGDGIFDKATDAFNDLNIATSLTWGRGQIWVLNPPFLLAYPDPDSDGFPNGKAVVHLTGFGLEDTHAVANSLRWGPDGWLYGAQGSTTWATINSSVSKDVHFKGQAIWRYHPETEIFEIYAEGGGNTFHVEIDEKGRVYSGHNGANSRGQYYKQGSYYAKNWGKHGALTNPYAFGYFPHMELEGEKLRFTHGFVKYDGATLPQRYNGSMISMNPLHNFMQVTDFLVDGSTFKNRDRERILTTDDHWFRPVDIKAGPDGGIYIADWYDSRLSHIDPRDTWHKGSGRIYRLRSKESESQENFDLSKYSTTELIYLLSHPNKWFRQQVLRQFGDRKDASVIPSLLKLLNEHDGQLALEALWALNLSGGFDETVAVICLDHIDPYVRMWAIRLLGDQRKVSETIGKRLRHLAKSEPHAEVRSQLASAAKRLPPRIALPIIKELMHVDNDMDDAHIPLLIWWALEAKAESDREMVVALWEDEKLWGRRIAHGLVLERLAQRYILAGGEENLSACARLFELAPTSAASVPLITGLTEGLRGKDVQSLPSRLLAALETHTEKDKVSELTIKIRQGNEVAIDQMLTIVLDVNWNRLERLKYIQILGEINQPRVVGALLDILRNGSSSPAIRQSCLQALMSYDSDEIGSKVLSYYPDILRSDPEVKLAALNLLASRMKWTQLLMSDIEKNRLIHANDIPVQLV